MVVRAVQVAGGEVTRVTRRDSLLYAATGPRVDIQVVSSDTLIAVASTHVSLDGTDYEARADAAGRIRVSPVLAGRYRARIATPLMDSLGVPAVAQEVEAREDAHVDTLRLPRPRDVLAKVCPRESIDHGEGMFVELFAIRRRRRSARRRSSSRGRPMSRSLGRRARTT